VAKRSHKKRIQMLLQLDDEEEAELCPMMQQEQMVDPSDMGGLQKKLLAAAKETEAALVLAVKVMQEMTSVLVAQGAQDIYGGCC
jgi:hypothetical protein